MGAAPRYSRNAAMLAALRLACSAINASAGSPRHSVCRMTRYVPFNMAAQREAVRQLPLLASRVPGVTMQTLDLERAAIGGLYEAPKLVAALRDARARTLAIYAGLDPDRDRFPMIAIVNPAAWELAHIAW